MGTAAIQLTEVSLRRGATEVLSDISFEVQESEIVAILGPSGRGKTTLLHAIAGLLAPSHGEISSRFSQPGIAFQDSLLLPWLNVRQNVALAYQFKKHSVGADAKQVSERITSILQAVGLSLFGQSFPHELSGGQAQRVSIARALVLNSEILLLDEPFSAVDAVTRGQLQNLVRTTRDRLGTTVLLVTHDIDEALAIADRVLVIADSNQLLELRPEINKQQEQKSKILLALGGNYVI